MTKTRLVAIALAALLVVAGSAVAAPGQAPDDPGADAGDAPDDRQPDDPRSHATNASDGNASDGDAAVEGSSHDEHLGPPTEMPETAPDHVREVHDLINEKICGCLTGQELGARISAVVGSGDAATEASETAPNASAEAGEPAAGAGERARATDGGHPSDAADDGQARAEQVGPKSGLPEQAADHVSAIHDAVSAFLSGDADPRLGAMLSGNAPG